MRIIVTGANGRLGRVVVAHLLEQGMEVVGLDREIISQSGASMIQVDLCDLGQVFGALVGAEAIVHLGAIPTPKGRSPELVYRNNVMSQFNIFEAAARLGIQRVVSASSISAFGFPFQHRWSEPLYLPLDEAHPLLPQDAYGLSKATGEEIAAAYSRRTGASAASLRISTIVSDETMQPLLERVRQNPGNWASSFWSYVHVNDVAQACLLALTHPYEGHQIFHITSNDTSTELPTDELLERWFPNVPRRTNSREPRWSLIDGTRAEEMLGYHPQYRWSNLSATTDEHAL
ncbi:MAG TPA: NAD(P)-dependent oxidoreductase [Ktedonobacteraceae bacterium]|jgi:nucleoside-diphosphate-sugar epimerase|nr:NAD(P)-dependent oxidoreductase [Ktedonobacteraceae bacterium]